MIFVDCWLHDSILPKSSKCVLDGNTKVLLKLSDYVHGIANKKGKQKDMVMAEGE